MNTMSTTDTPTFISKYKPYFIRDFFLNPEHHTVLNTLFSLDDIHLLIVGAPCCGKTSLLNAIIRDYYGLNKNSQFPEHNIMFINNLKEQGIHFFRNEMKTFCQSYSNIYGKKKLIVIDDIDTINEQSQQVFRNYIDKYSNNVHFISVCTNIQKVNESLQSRLHIIKMNMIEREHLDITAQKIITNENIKVSHDAIQFLINISNNSIRTLINHLEKIYVMNQHGESFDLEKVIALCSNISYAQFETYIGLLRDKKTIQSIKILYEIYDYGYSVIDIFDYFFQFIKYTELLDETVKYKIIKSLCKYITIFHKVHEDPIELAYFTLEIQPEICEKC